MIRNKYILHARNGLNEKKYIMQLFEGINIKESDFLNFFLVI